MRKISITIFSLFCAVSLNIGAQSEVVLKSVLFPKSADFSSLSDNGKWATAKGVGEEDASKDAFPFLINIETGAFNSLWEQESDYLGAYDVTNDGKIVVGNKENLPAYCNTDTKVWTSLEIAESYNSGVADVVTPDGSFISGYGSAGDFGGDNYKESPLLWEKQGNDSYKLIDVLALEGFPTVDKSGKKSNIIRLTMMSPDGNIIGGVMNFILPIEQTTFIYNRTTKEYKLIDKLLPTSESFVDFATMSNNGKYITGVAYVIDGDTEYSSSFLYDVEKDNMTIYNETSEEKDRSGNFVSNSGIVYAASPAVSPVRTLYYRVGNFWYGIDEVLAYKYNINFYDRLDYLYTGYTVGVSDDEKTMIAMSGSKTSGYILTLPETFQDAAKGINLLKTYVVSPESGSVFSKFKQADITFAKETVLKSGAKAELLDNSGKVVKSYTIESSSSTKYLVGGLPYTLKDGEKYTLRFPAGIFSLKGDESTTNEEITVNYVGRADTPVTVKQISPVNNTNVSEISSDSPVTINFDIKVIVKENAQAYLYQEGSETPITNLAIAANGSSVAFYPPLKRYLTKDVKYRVEIPADIITDIMGGCGNDEIVINYTGAYEQQIDVTEGTIFSDDFNDVSNSMVRYLLYEGDHRTPTSEMQQLSFDKDNTPWNFSIRETEESADYCTASMSCYNPAGQSDDWMSIPQLYIENADYYLEFDAQSYKKSKTDVLKVYALVEDNTYDVFTTELYNKFKSEGKVIFEETLTPGESEEGLAGDWKSYSVHLDEFAGKNVYLAFVNENNNQSMVFVDNLKVIYKGDFLIGIMSPSMVVDKESQEIKAFVKVTGDKTYKSLKATCTSLDGSFSDTFEANDLSLDKNSENYVFTFKKELPVEIGKENFYKITVTLDGTEYSVQSSIKNLAFEPVKRVVIEEGTGAWCGNCPLGILAFENLHKIYGDLVIPVAIHNGDVYAYDSYMQYLGMSAFPCGMVNRIDTIYSPAISESGVYSFVSAEGNKTFEDIVRRELAESALSDLNISHAIYDKSKNLVEIEATLKYAMDMPSINQNLLFIVTENGLPGAQKNYLYGNEDPLFGEWGKGGKYGESVVEIDYNEVARKVLGTFSGIPGSVPGNATANQEIKYLYQYQLPANVTDWNNAEVVCVLLDGNTKRALNAAKLEFSEGVAGIDEASASENAVSIYGGDASLNLVFAEDTKAAVAIYDMNGTLVGMRNVVAAAGEVLRLETGDLNGLYIVNVVTPDSSSVQKVIIR